MRFRITIFLTLVIAVAAFAQNDIEPLLGKPIKDLTFSGLINVNDNELSGVVEQFIGKRFDIDLYFDMETKLYSLELFDKIELQSAEFADTAQNEIILNFSVVEKPIISELRFKGNIGVRTNELLDIITIKKLDTVNSIRLKVDVAAIREKYLERGYKAVEVKTETELTDKNTIILTFVISEGQKSIIEAFRFEGNTAFSEATLKGTLSLKTKSLFNDGAFQEAKLILDIVAVRDYYRERGYIDAEVVDVAREERQDEKGVNLITLIFKVKEGRQYSFGGISFEGNKVFPTEQLASLVFSKTGQILNFKRLETDFQRVAELYYENGYIFNTINRIEERDEDKASIRYIISIVERDRAHIENIIIKGNERTKDEVILREIPLETGDIYSNAKVIEALRNLYSLQYFSEVYPEMPQGSAENLMDLVFNVTEQSTADIQFGVTFSGTSSADSFPISGFIKWAEQNFMGNGQTIGLEVNAATDTQKISLQFSERWLFGLPLSGGFDFTLNHSKTRTAQDSIGPLFNGDEDSAFPDPFLSYEEYVNSNKIVPDAYLMNYDSWGISLGFSSGYRFYLPSGTLSLGAGLRTGFVRNSYDSELYRPFDPTLRAGNNLWLFSNSLFGNVSLDTRYIYYDPSSGYFLSQKFGAYGILPVEKEHYFRTDSKAEYYATLFDLPLTDSLNFKMVFGVHSGLSMILPQFIGEAVIENSNKLALDGMFTARGWYTERTNYGTALWENWMELRSPVVPGVLALDWFFDAATVKSSPESLFNSLSLDDFRFSFGAGIRFTIPQFPFRFSLAKRFRFVDGQFNWVTGGLWRNENEGSGLDFVISFVVPST